jgi:hypothetical protein
LRRSEEMKAVIARDVRAKTKMIGGLTLADA